MKQIINRKLYDTDTANQLASDRLFDGRGLQRDGRNTYLYKTAKGNYFLLHVTSWEGEQDHIQPIDEQEAATHYEQMPLHHIDFTDAFPNIPLEEA